MHTNQIIKAAMLGSVSLCGSYELQKILNDKKFMKIACKNDLLVRGANHLKHAFTIYKELQIINNNYITHMKLLLKLLRLTEDEQSIAEINNTIHNHLEPKLSALSKYLKTLPLDAPLTQFRKYDNYNISRKIDEALKDLINKLTTHIGVYLIKCYFFGSKQFEGKVYHENGQQVLEFTSSNTPSTEARVKDTVLHLQDLCADCEALRKCLETDGRPGLTKNPYIGSWYKCEKCCHAIYDPQHRQFIDDYIKNPNSLSSIARMLRYLLSQSYTQEKLQSFIDNMQRYEALPQGDILGPVIAFHQKFSEFYDPEKAKLPMLHIL